MKNFTSPLLTDLYQLTMMQAYYDNAMEEEAVFEFFFRKLPKERSFLIACGLEQALEYLEDLRFSEDDLRYLRQDGRFHARFIDRLQDFRFTGSVHGMAEGTVFFPDEPILRVTAPMPEAQLVETRLINIMQLQTMIATKAVRMTRIYPEKTLIDYGLRRSHGAEAGILAARASYIAGFAGTATVLAGKVFGIPTFGTMAHSFIQAHDSETEAFMHFAASHPDNTTILLDTYDTEEAARKVVELASRLAQKGIRIRGVRLDSGDMISLSKSVRRILDEGGLREVKIFASGSLDEYSLAEFRCSQAPVDGFGIGSKMTTSADVPCYDCAYKLVEYGGFGRRKLSKGKTTWPGRKQVFRHLASTGVMEGDILALESEQREEAPLISRYMENGTRSCKLPSLGETRAFLQDQIQRLPEGIDKPDFRYPVVPSPQLCEFAEKVTERTLQGQK